MHGEENDGTHWTCMQLNNVSIIAVKSNPYSLTVMTPKKLFLKIELGKKIKEERKKIP